MELLQNSTWLYYIWELTDKYENQTAPNPSTGVVYDNYDLKFVYMWGFQMIRANKNQFNSLAIWKKYLIPVWVKSLISKIKNEAFTSYYVRRWEIIDLDLNKIVEIEELEKKK